MAVAGNMLGAVDLLGPREHRATVSIQPIARVIWYVKISNMDEPLNLTQHAILEFLLRDALECGKVYHFDPGWVAKALDLHELEMRTASRALAALGAVSIHEFRERLTDIVIMPNAASLIFGPG